MRRTVFPVLGMLCLFGAGCLDPGSLKQTERDLLTYRGGGAVELPGVERHTVSVGVTLAVGSPWGPGGDAGLRRDLAAAAGGGLREMLGGLEAFEVVRGDVEGEYSAEVSVGEVRLTERMEQVLETRERWVTDLDGPRGPGGRRPRHREVVEEWVWETRYGVTAEVDWVLRDGAGRAVISGHETAESRMGHVRPDDAGMGVELSADVRGAAMRFGQAAGRAFAPRTRVVETRGGGRVARIPAGSAQGYYPGTGVEFYELRDESDLLSGGAAVERSVAKGTVHSESGGGAWIEVKGWKKAGVMRGHFVRVSR